MVNIFPELEHLLYTFYQVHNNIHISKLFTIFKENALVNEKKKDI